MLVGTFRPCTGSSRRQVAPVPSSATRATHRRLLTSKIILRNDISLWLKYTSIWGCGSVKTALIFRQEMVSKSAPVRVITTYLSHYPLRAVVATAASHLDRVGSGLDGLLQERVLRSRRELVCRNQINRMARRVSIRPQHVVGRDQLDRRFVFTQRPFARMEHRLEILGNSCQEGVSMKIPTHKDAERIRERCIRREPIAPWERQT